MAEIELPKTEELEEMRAKRFTRAVAITTAFYAVVLAITALGGNSSTKEMLLAQQEASNQWSYYQAKNMRENLYRIQRLYVEADFLDRADTMKPETRARFEATIKKMSDEESRYANEKKEIEREARKAEHERDVNKKKNPYFEFAEVLIGFEEHVLGKIQRILAIPYQPEYVVENTLLPARDEHVIGINVAAARFGDQVAILDFSEDQQLLRL